MSLREPALLGLDDPRQLSVTQPRRTVASAHQTDPVQRHSNEPQAGARHTNESATVSKQSTAQRESARATTPEALAGEWLEFVQVDVPSELRRRVEFASFELAGEHPRIKKHQTILAGLLWRYVDHKRDDTLRALGRLLDQFTLDPLGEARPDGRLAARVPFSLKRRLDGAALRLRATHQGASARTILSALVWRHVDISDPHRFASLTRTLLDYDRFLRDGQRRLSATAHAETPMPQRSRRGNDDPEDVASATAIDTATASLEAG